MSLSQTERIDSNALTGSHKAPQHCRRLAAFITAKENPVVATHCYGADRRSVALLSMGRSPSWQ
jgi:hypothetical protein